MSLLWLTPLCDYLMPLLCVTAMSCCLMVLPKITAPMSLLGVTAVCYCLIVLLNVPAPYVTAL